MLMKDVRRYHSATAEKQKNKKFLTPPEIRAKIATQLGSSLHKNFSIHIADEKYFCPLLENAVEILKNSAVEQDMYISEIFDCDDFAHILKSNFIQAAYARGERRYPHCFGILWGMLYRQDTNKRRLHAVNWMINDDGKVRLIDFMKRKVEDTNIEKYIYFPREEDRMITFMLL